MPCSQAFPHRTSSGEDGKCSNLKTWGQPRACTSFKVTDVGLPVRERRCIFVEFDFASFEAAILVLDLGFVAAVDGDISDLYV